MRDTAMAITIRRATAADAEAVAGLIRELGHPASARDIPDRLAQVDATPGQVLVAVKDGEVLGMLSVQRMTLIHRAGPIAFLSTLAVRPDARRLGVGRALVAEVEQLARTWSCGTIELTSRNDRHDAHRFWQALGFEPRSRKFVRDVSP